MSDEQIKALVLNFLRRKKRWNNHYYNRQKITRYLGLDVLHDGEAVERNIDELIKDGLVNLKKKGDTISLNTRFLKEISEHIKNYLLPEFI